jgi:hypothetical protein
MNNFQSRFNPFVSQQGFGAAPSALGSDLGAPAGRKKPVSADTKAKVLKKFRWLRDEDTGLKFAFDSKMPKRAKAVFLKLARMREHFRNKAWRVLHGRSGGQVARRAILAVPTMGVSELAHLILKRPLSWVHKKHALRLVAKADACDILIRYWQQQFHKRAAEQKRKAAKGGKFREEYMETLEAVQTAASVSADGSSASIPPQPGELDITATVSESETDDAAENVGEAQDDGGDEDFGGFAGLTGKQVMGFGALGVLAGLAVA